MFPITIVSGPVGSLVLNEKAGALALVASAKGSFGGGSIAGAAGFALSAEFDLSAIQLADAGLVALAAKYPSLSPTIAILKAAMDAEAAKI